MELRHLRYFVAVAELLSFTKAASRLGISQPPLSLQIQQLEREIGTGLFHRAPGAVELTDAGKIFLPRAHEILTAVGKATEAAQRTARGELGELSLGLSGSTPYHGSIQTLLRTFHRRFPHTAVAVRETQSAELVRLVRDGSLDCAFVLEPTDVARDLVVTTAFSDRLVVVLPEGHPLAARRKVPLAALAEERFVVVPRSVGPGLHDLTLAMCREAGFSPVIGQESSRTASAVCFVAAGLGVALVPGWLAAMQTVGVVYRPIAKGDPRIRIVAIRRRDRKAAVIDQLLVVVREMNPS